MSGAGVDPSERARIMLLRGDELLESEGPESLDEALLAFQGGLEVATEADDDELVAMLETRVATVRARLGEGEPASE
jgi:hypothetical protein